MKLRLSCADFSFPLLPHDQSLQLIAMLGFKEVDIGLFEARSHLQPSQVLRSPGKSAHALRRTTQDLGLALSDIYLIPGTSFEEMAPNNPDPRVRRAARDQFKRATEFAAHAGSPHVSGLPGVRWPGRSHADSLKRSAEELAWRVDVARSHDLTFSVEAHIGSVTPTPKDALRLLALCPGLTLTLDYTHFTQRGLPDRAIEPLVPHSSHIHCRGASRGHLQRSFADNTIDYRRMLKVAQRAGFRGAVCVEYVWIEWQGCNQCDNLSETIRFRDYLRQQVRAAK